MEDTFRALDDKTRREILELLIDGKKTAGEIADKFYMTKPSISYHLDLLRQGKLVNSEKKGQFIFYTLNTDVLDDTIRWFFKLIKSKYVKEDS